MTQGDLPLGVVIYATPEQIASALKGYIFQVVLHDGMKGTLWKQEVKFTGYADERGIEAIIVKGSEDE